ncbi:MAG: CD1375 family protein [Anaerovibrio sp.]|nr:CD1375 family protein [Anaerovibrio sp.]MEE1306751.1 CD1375 family protein [Anaerovibrio sp.]
MYDVMVRMYGRLVIYKRKTIDEVPEEYRKDVEAWIAAQKK